MEIAPLKAMTQDLSGLYWALADGV